MMTFDLQEWRFNPVNNTYCLYQTLIYNATAKLCYGQKKKLQAQKQVDQNTKRSFYRVIDNADKNKTTLNPPTESKQTHSCKNVECGRGRKQNYFPRPTQP